MKSKKCSLCYSNITSNIIGIIFVFIIILFSYKFIFYKNLSSINICNNVNNNSNNSKSDGVINRELSIPFINYGINSPIGPIMFNPPITREILNINDLRQLPIQQTPLLWNNPTSISYVNDIYRQVGILTPLYSKTKDNILPLMGRQLSSSRDKWNYYSLTNQFTNVQLPLKKNGKSCTNEYGCDKLFSGDVIYVEGLGEPYKVLIYQEDNSYSYRKCQKV